MAWCLWLYHGVGEMNESGKSLLYFCAMNKLIVMNTLFEKANVFKYTWQHPGNETLALY